MTVSMRRLDLGCCYRPAPDGTSEAIPVYAYLVRHAEGYLLLDTGIGEHPEIDAYYRPKRRDLGTALADVGASLDAVGIVVNCHLHFDHSGGNPLFAGRPIVVQRAELDIAGEPGYTIPGLVDFAGVRYEQLDGEAEVVPDVWIVPTPGHTAGHQSVVIRRSDGSVVLAGQATESSHEFGESTALWRQRLLDFDPREVLFAHDATVWTPS